MNYYGFPKFTQKSAKIKEKGNRSCTENPRVSKNHATAHKYYSCLHIWNPGLFLIPTRGPFFFLLLNRRDGTGDGEVESGLGPADGCCKGRRGQVEAAAAQRDAVAAAAGRQAAE